MCPWSKEGNTFLGCISQNSAIMPCYIDLSPPVSTCYTHLVNHELLSSSVKDWHGDTGLSPVERDSLDGVSVDEPCRWMGSSSTRSKRRNQGNSVCSVLIKKEKASGMIFAVCISLTGRYRENQETFQRSVQ